MQMSKACCWKAVCLHQKQISVAHSEPSQIKMCEGKMCGDGEMCFMVCECVYVCVCGWGSAHTDSLYAGYEEIEVRIKIIERLEAVVCDLCRAADSSGSLSLSSSSSQVDPVPGAE